MPGVRLDRFLASTAIVVLLSATAGGGVADPMGGGDTGAPAMTAAPATEGNSGQAAAKREGPADEAPAPDASAKPNQSDTAAKPHQSGEQPAAAAAAPPAKADQATGQPASTAAAPATPAKPEQATDQPAVPATTVATPSPAPASNQDQAAEKPAAPGAAAIPSQQPAGAAGENGAPTTATIAPAAAAPAPVADGNTPIAEQLRGLAGGKFDRIIGGKKDRATIDAFYSGRDYAPLWLSDGKPNAKTKAAIAYLGQVDADGLDPADYPVPDFASLTDPAALAEAEMRLTTSIITYAHHAQIGRVHWTRRERRHFLRPEGAGAGRHSRRHSRRQGHRPGARRLRTARAGLSRAQGQARRTARRQRQRGACADSDRTHTEDRRAGRSGAAAARAARPAGGQRHHLRQDACRGSEEIPAGARAQADRHAHRRDRRRAQRPPAGSSDRHHHRQSGTLALDAARSRQELRDGQSSRLHAARLSRRQAGVDDADRRRQAGDADANHDRGDEVHHRQSDLERAAFDRRQGISAGAGAGPDGAGTDGTAGQPQSRRHYPHFPAARRPERARPAALQLPQQVPGLSARHAGQEPVRPGPPRVQPWLHARAGSGEIRRGSALDRAPAATAIPRTASAGCSAAANRTSSSRNSSRSI